MKVRLAVMAFIFGVLSSVHTIVATPMAVVAVKIVIAIITVIIIVIVVIIALLMTIAVTASTVVMFRFDPYEIANNSIGAVSGAVYVIFAQTANIVATAAVLLSKEHWIDVCVHVRTFQQLAEIDVAWSNCDGFSVAAGSIAPVTNCAVAFVAMRPAPCVHPVLDVQNGKGHQAHSKQQPNASSSRGQQHTFAIDGSCNHRASNWDLQIFLRAVFHAVACAVQLCLLRAALCCSHCG